MRDAAEVARIASDAEALEAFYRRHFDAVRRFVVRRVDDPHLAADLIAEVFLAAISSAGSYRPEWGGQLPWLYGVARNVVAAEERRSARQVRAERSWSARALLDPDDIADLTERIDAEAASRRLYEAIRQMSDDDRRLLELVAVDGLSVRDAGKVLGVSPGAARVRLHRARRCLQQLLNHPYPDLAHEVPVKEA
jgi:RNA polymerase sigma factor (sigma-70 family)